MATSTRRFGAGNREGHDSSAFYARRLVDATFSDDKVCNDAPEVDRIWCHSAEAMTELPDASVALMVTSPPYHVGKALRSSTPVLTPTGWVKIGELSPGDVVYAGDGLPTLVEGVFPQGARQLYRMTFDDGSWVDCDLDHLWYCQTFTQRDKRNGRGDEWVVISTREILERWGADPIAPYRVVVPTAGPIDFTANELPIAPYDLGAILGDGCIIPGGYVRVCCGDPEVFDRLETEAGTPRGRDGIERPLNGLAPVIRELGLDHHRAWEKFIPPDYLFSSIDDRVELLRGLMDTDGSIAVGNGSVEYSTTSPRLAEDVTFLIRSLGGKVFPITVGGAGRPAFRIRFRIEMCPFALERKARPWLEWTARRTHTNNRVLRTIRRVDLDDATCIKVAHPTGTFVTKDLIVTHNTYDQESTFAEYLALLERVFTETYRVLEPGGRAVVNVANLGRKPYIPLAAIVTQMMTERLGYLMRGEVIWRKAEAAGGSCAWGSWRSASNPTLRDVHEYCLCFSKGRMDRARRGESTIDRDEFLAATLSIWDIPPESARRVGHPAPFPVALPRRFIELYTYEGDLVLDPFMGSGSTAVAAVETGRHYAGYDVDPEYVALAEERIAAAVPAPPAAETAELDPA